MNIIQSQLKKDIPEIRPGDTIVVHQKIKEKDKERIQSFEGLVIAKKHGNGINSTITVRRMVQGVGMEKIYPIHSPVIDKIEVLRHSKVRRAKLYYIREKAAKEARKNLRQTLVVKEEQPAEELAPKKEPLEQVETK